MAKKHKPEEIVLKLGQVVVLTSQGTPIADAIRSIGVTEMTYYQLTRAANRFFGTRWWSVYLFRRFPGSQTALDVEQGTAPGVAYARRERRQAVDLGGVSCRHWAYKSGSPPPMASVRADYKLPPALH